MMKNTLGVFKCSPNIVLSSLHNHIFCGRTFLNDKVEHRNEARQVNVCQTCHVVHEKQSARLEKCFQTIFLQATLYSGCYSLGLGSPYSELDSSGSHQHRLAGVWFIAPWIVTFLLVMGILVRPCSGMDMNLGTARASMTCFIDPSLTLLAQFWRPFRFGRGL